MDESLPIGQRVENWHSNCLPAQGLTAQEREEIIEDAQGSFLAEFVGQTEQQLLALDDKALVDAHYWAMHEATR